MRSLASPRLALGRELTVEMEFILALVMRWVHIVSAVFTVGGSVFIPFVLLPVVSANLSESERGPFRDAVMKRWKAFFHPFIILFLVSGFYNYMAVTAPLHQGQALYHALFGVKFLLAIAFFGLAIIATSTMAWSKKMRARSGIWALLVLTGLLIVLIAGFMKVMPAAASEDAGTAAPAESVEEIS